MAHKVLVLESAKADFREIRKYVTKHFGDWVWAEVNQEFKDAIKHLAANPLLGTPVEELSDFGYQHVRQTLVRQTRLVYEFDNKQVIVHLFIHTKRDFRTHLEQRLLAPVWPG